MPQPQQKKLNEEAMLIRSIMPMMKNVFELFSPELLKGTPESEAVRVQSNILAAHLYNSPLGTLLKEVLTLQDFARILYNNKQTDYDTLYEVVERMKKEKEIKI